MPTLFQCLRDADPARLEAIVRFWDIELLSSGRRERAAELASAMSGPEAILNAWHSLDRRESNALTDLLARGGSQPAKVFERRWGEIRAMGPARMEREQPWREPTSAAEGLWY